MIMNDECARILQKIVMFVSRDRNEPLATFVKIVGNLVEIQTK
jgi:hypothetical protein